MCPQYGSIFNQLMSDSKSDTIEVGMGATVLFYSDRDAATVIWVSKTGKTARIQKDYAVRTDGNGMSDMQSYAYQSNPDGEVMDIYLNKRGFWKVSKEGYAVLLGVRQQFFDYTF